jgi:ATP-dependent RNA helicase RhlE
MANIEILVLDEADRMFDMGFLPDVRRIVKAVPEKRQTMLFSATFPADVELLAQQALKQPQKIAMGISQAPRYTVTHALYPVPPHLKSALLIELLKRTDTNSVLVFTRTKYRAQKVCPADPACRLSSDEFARRPFTGAAAVGAERFQGWQASDHGRH